MRAELKINLSKYSERFAENSRDFSISSRINFIFGKNGTGKTTIADAVKEQFSNVYNVSVFKDFDGVVEENGRLNAVALGTENAKIQVKIETVNREIEKIKKEIDEPVDKARNFFTEAKKAEENYKKQEAKINKFFENSAQRIKNLSNPQIAKTSYFKTDFKGEIANAKLLSEDEIKKNKETIRSDKKEKIIASNAFPDIDLSSCLKSTNFILQSSVSQQQVVDELKNNSEKQNFAKEGMQIHKHKNGEKCAFCGNEISEERWKLLGSYFNNEVNKLEGRIKQNIREIKDGLDKLSSLQEISKDDFYNKFIGQVKSLNLQIKNSKNEYKIFLGSLKAALEDKTKNLFTKSSELKISIPANFGETKKNYYKVVKENNVFSKNLDDEREKAKNVLRYHEIKKLLDSFKYDEQKANLKNFETIKDETQRLLDNKTTELENKKEEKTELIARTKDEEQIAIKINRLLKNIGCASFSLQLVNNDDENQKGQYRIKRLYHKEGEFDDVTNLSKGEKNIVAFLYFLFSNEELDNNHKPKIIILDDPMTSNDDTMQYLMISEIQKIYRNLGDENYFLLLTHNCHFYLNVRPNTAIKYRHDEQEVSFYEKYGNYYLFSDGKHTSIKSIKDGKQDFKTNYELLWKEIQFLYREDNATADIMLNPFRKICETYMKFNCIGMDKFFESNSGVKKLYDVNQHSVDDLEAEQNGKTKEEIKQILKQLFINNNAEKHFNRYWQ